MYLFSSTYSLIYYVYIWHALTLRHNAHCLVVSPKLDTSDTTTAVPKTTDISVDSSLSPQLAKAFYEVHFGTPRPLAPTKTIDSIFLRRLSMGCDLPGIVCRHHYGFPKVAINDPGIEFLEEQWKRIDDVDVDIPVFNGKEEADKSIVNKHENIAVPGIQSPDCDEKNLTMEENVPVYNGVIDVESVLQLTGNVGRSLPGWYVHPYHLDNTFNVPLYDNFPLHAAVFHSTHEPHPSGDSIDYFAGWAPYQYHTPLFPWKQTRPCHSAKPCSTLHKKPHQSVSKAPPIKVDGKIDSSSSLVKVDGKIDV